MTIGAIYKLQIITLLDSICFGLTYPFLSTYMQSLGADHVTVGTLSVGYLLCNLISTDHEVPLMKTYGKSFALTFNLLMSMISHLCLILTDNYWHIVIGRCVFSATVSYSENLYRDIILQKAEDDKRECYLTVFSILNGCGYIIGPIIAGYLFSIHFFYIGLLAVSLSFINVCLTITIADDSNISITGSDDERTVSGQIYQNLNGIANNCRKCDYGKNWDLIAIKFLYVSFVTIYFGKFTQILNHNFKSSPATIGCAYAYMNALTFAGTYFTTTIKGWYAQFSPVLLVEYYFKIIVVCLLIACYSPLYIIYLITCMPIVFLSAFTNSLWKDLFATRNNDSLDKLNDPLKVAAGLSTPLAFGVLCNYVGHHAVIAFSIVPIIVSLCIINRNTKQYNFVEQADKKKD